MTSATAKQYQHVNDLWDDAEANNLSAAERLVYRSNSWGRINGSPIRAEEILLPRRWRLTR